MRDPYDDDDFPRTSSWIRQQCLRQRLGRQVIHDLDPLGSLFRGRGGGGSVCRSSEYWTRVTLSTNIRFVNLSSLTPANQPSPIPFPPDILLVRPGEASTLDIHTTNFSSGVGVAASVTQAVIIAVPSLLVARRNHGMWPVDSVSSAPAADGRILLKQPAAKSSINPVLLTASQANTVCIGGLGCNFANGAIILSKSFSLICRHHMYTLHTHAYTLHKKFNCLHTFMYAYSYTNTLVTFFSILYHTCVSSMCSKTTSPHRPRLFQSRTADRQSVRWQLLYLY